MNKIVEIAPGAIFVSPDWGSTLVQSYDTNTVSVSQGIYQPEPIEQPEEDPVISVTVSRWRASIASALACLGRYARFYPS